MTNELKMPALSPTMEKGTLAKWLIGEGDRVNVGDLIAEIETDKATMELEATEVLGRISRLVIAEGTDDVPVGTVIALLAEAEDDQHGEHASEIEETVPLVAGLADPVLRAVEAEPPSVGTQRPKANAGPVAIVIAPTGRVNASPLARRIAAANGIDLSAITGSSANGRVLRADLSIKPPIGRPEQSLRMAGTAAAVVAPPAGVPVETVKLSSMRRTIARRLGESKQTVPHFYLTARCRLDDLLGLRAELNASLVDRGVKLSVNDMLIKALALALREEPDANVQFGGDVLYRFARADIAMAVAVDGGLITPVIRNADQMSLSAIAMASKSLATRARDGQLAFEDYEGGTASISNLGMFGIDEMFPVINPPQALILGVAAGVEQPWKVDGTIALATIMAATASFDHRAIDGAAAARFMKTLRELVETPILLCS